MIHNWSLKASAWSASMKRLFMIPNLSSLQYRGPVDAQLDQAVQGLIDGESGALVATATDGASIDYSGVGVSSAPS